MKRAPTLSRCYWFLIALALAGSVFYAFSAGYVYSDLHPVWTSTRAVVHHADPYSPALATAERIRFHTTVAGTTPYDLRFAYPFPATFLFAPLALLSFDRAWLVFTLIGLFLTICSVKWWTGELRWPIVLLVLAARPVMLGIASQQPTVLFAALIAAAFACMRAKHATMAGAILALTIAKPQMLAFVAIPIALWVAADWKKRRRLPIAFLAVSATLIAASFALQPNWFSEWLAALRIYRTYAGDSIPTSFFGHRFGFAPSLMLFGLRTGLAVSAILTIAGAFAMWRVRHQPDELLAVSITTALVVTPFQPYNAMLLIPAVVLFFRSSSEKPSVIEVIARLSVFEVWAFPILALLIGLRFPAAQAQLSALDLALTQVLVCSLLAVFLKRSFSASLTKPAVELQAAHS